jgi:hypothetical protein
MEVPQRLSQAALFVKYNIQVVYTYTSLNVNHVLKDYLQKGNTSLTSTELLYCMIRNNKPPQQKIIYILRSNFKTFREFWYISQEFPGTMYRSCAVNKEMYINIRRLRDKVRRKRPKKWRPNNYPSQ